ncbi:MAG TPA: FG-GAP-like repeat-containing protein [Candidatus Saccharimonadales bacterium]|nr:FG-GAP-like repeat-containing protein [Candidatus Saccharimonadales bacterium]
MKTSGKPGGRFAVPKGTNKIAFGVALILAGLVGAALASWVAFHRKPAISTSAKSNLAAPLLISAVKPAPGSPPPTITPLASAEEGQITLDPVCETIASQTPSLAPGNPAPSTRQMVQRLVKLYAESTPSAAGYMSDRMAETLHGEMASATGLNEKFRLQFMLAIQQINAARPDAALNTFSSMERLISQSGGYLDKRTSAELRMRKGIAFFRLGEQENCLATHNADSCVFPLKPKAYHLLPRGSRGAIALFDAALAENPDDFKARWLLNLAHMTLGEYPDKVNPQSLIPAKCFASEYEMPRFYDVSDGLGVDANDLAGGVIVDDFDNDGLYDLVISAWDAKGQLRYFHNNGNGTFKERTSEAGLVGEVGALNIQQTDYNNDGLLDIWMLRGAWLGKGGRIPNSLLRNNGDGTFSDVTEQAGLLSFHPTQASRWFDYDGDGWLDLFIGNESTDPRDPDYCELYHNNRDGTFTECAKACGINVAQFIKGVACADYDNDGRPDLYLSVRREGPKLLLHNDGPDASGQWHFSNVAPRTGVNNHVLSFGTFFFDYDNDGWEDLLLFGYDLPNGVADVAKDYMGLPNEAAKPRLYHNNRDGTFRDVTAEAHLNRVCHTMGHNYGDLDNDGWLDFYCGTGDPDFTTLIPNRMFRNAEGKFFQDVTTATGTGHIQKGHGVAFADFNDDGFQDVYSALGGAYSGDFARNALFLNPGNTNHWVKLKLVGTKANRAAIGARIKLTLKTPTGARELYRTVSSGGNFGSNPLRQEIGLGDAKSIIAVDIRWPGSDTRQTLTGLEVDRAYQIKEGEAAPLVLKLKPVKLDKPALAANEHGLHAAR